MATRKSRLERIEEKKATRSAFFYILLSLVFVVFLLRFGIGIVSSFAGFIMNLVGSSTTRPISEDSFIAPPRIDPLPRSIKENKINVTGNAAAGTTVLVYLNDTFKEVISNSSGEFNASLELYQNIPNEIYSVVQNGNKTSPQSNKFIVIVDKEAPKLEIISPSNDNTFYGETNRQVKIEGQSEVEAKVVINDRITIVRSDGKFEYLVRLENGENTFKIKATDEAGNETEIEYKLYFNS